MPGIQIRESDTAHMCIVQCTFVPSDFSPDYVGLIKRGLAVTVNVIMCLLPRAVCIQMLKTVTNLQDKGRVSESVMLYGYGDGGGGPT